MIKTAYFLILSYILSFDIYAQSLVGSANLPRTKIVLETDSTTYFAGQKVNVKATLFDAQTEQLDSLNSTLFIELVNNKSVILNKWILKINGSKAGLNFQLPQNLNSGYYYLRAYTNWMSSFAAEAIPTSEILVLGSNFEAEIRKDADLKKYSLAFKPEGGRLVKGLINRGLVVIKDNYQNGIETDGFLVINQDTVATFKTDRLGQALVQFTPIEGQPHKIITPKAESDISSQIISEGVVIRGDWIDNSSRLRVLIQSNLALDSMPHLIAQTRGVIYQYLPLSKNETIVYFNQKDLKSGVLNIGVISNDGKVYAERAFYISNDSENIKSKYLLYDSELDSPIENTQTRDINVELIGKQNVLYGFTELLKTRSLPKNLERGVVISGKVKRPNGKSIKTPANISLSILPSELDTLNSKQFLVGLSDPNGHFVFENLDFYGQVECTLNASQKNEALNIELENLSAPILTNRFRDIDWSRFQKKQIEAAKTEWQNHIYQIDTLNKEKTIELNELVVKASKIKPNSSNILLKDPPIKRFFQDKLIGGGNVMQLFFKQHVAFRLQKYPNPKILMLLDDNRVFSLDNIDSGIIAYIDILDGTAEANMLGADIVINIYTKYHTINPIVREYLEKNQITFPKKIKLQGYEYVNLKPLK
ncbi:MAG: hypothetical protein ACK4NY_23690 [Spirosomataceae bacterium]